MHSNIIISHVDMIMLHFDKVYLVCRRQKFATILKRSFCLFCLVFLLWVFVSLENFPFILRRPHSRRRAAKFAYARHLWQLRVLWCATPSVTWGIRLCNNFELVFTLCHKCNKYNCLPWKLLNHDGNSYVTQETVIPSSRVFLLHIY